MGDREDHTRVYIQLSPQQVDAVIATAYREGVPHAQPPPGQFGPRPESVHPESARSEPLQWAFRSLREDRTLSHSLLLGLQVLSCFPLDGTERGVADVAGQLEMNTSTIHRYMTTLARVGLLERNPETRWYRLAGGGPDVDGRGFDGLGELDALGGQR